MSNNIFDFFKLLDNCDLSKLSQLSEAEKKKLSPVVLIKWLASTPDKEHLLNLNAIVNPLIFGLYKHQDLLFKLMMACSNSKYKKYKWIKTGNINSKHDNILSVISQYYNCSKTEADSYYKTLNNSDILEMCSELNLDITQIEKIKKEF